MRFVLAIACAIFVIRAADANPIVYDPSHPSSLVSERVNISLKEKGSDVSGKFTFRQSKDVADVNSGDSVAIEVPFFAPWPRGLVSLKSSAVASVKIDERVFYPSSVSAGEVLRGLPENWRMFALEFEVPRNALTPEFVAWIHYRQQYLPGNISAYYPVEPSASARSKSLVRFVAHDGLTLELVSNAKQVVERSSTRFVIKPENRRLILIRARGRKN
jgi:hypothetical protein